MKKIITILTIIAFCFQPTAYAIAAEKIQLTDEINNYQLDKIKSLQKQDDTINANAFNNNYQNTIDNSFISSDLSPIELMFNGKDSIVLGKALKQVGYDMFTGSTGTTSTSGGKFDNSYKLSIGEKVNIYSYGDSVDVMAISGSTLLNPNVKTEVDSKGNLFVQGVGMFPAENRTISEVENSINAVARSKYKNLKVRLTVASGQEFSVFVYGQVNRPGRVAIGNNSSIFDALNAAGGVKKTGSLRNITYTTNNSKRNIDLYNVLFTGTGEIPVIKPNDKIYVDKIGDVVAIKNGVTLPGIYEVKANENIETLVKYAGGFLAATQASDVTLTGLDKTTNQRVAQNLLWNDAKSTKLNNGDSIEFRELYNTAENIVILQGNIKHPATYAYKDGMRLSDILKSENELLEETFINQAVIRRVSGKDNSVETIPVFLKEFFAGMNDPLLQPKDIINVYRNTNSNFVDVYGCINTPKHLTYIENMKLSDVMTDIQFLESDIQDNDDNENPSAFDGTEQNDTALTGTTQNVNKLISAENVAVEIISSDGSTSLYYLYDIMINSDKIKSISLKEDDKVFFRTLRNNEILKKVKISGFVLHPGVYTFVEGKKLTDMIEIAGGLTSEAELRGIVYKRPSLQGKQSQLAYKNNERDIRLIEGRLASGYKQSELDQKNKMDMIEQLKEDQETVGNRYSGQIALNIKSNELDKIKDSDNITVQDGDDIYIPRISDYVSIIGEVYNEQAFAFKKGANAGYYIKEVGGYTPNANKFRLYKIGVNGRAVKISRGSQIEQGDTIIVPRKVAGNDWITPICQTLQGLASVFIMAFGINKW